MGRGIYRLTKVEASGKSQQEHCTGLFIANWSNSQSLADGAVGCGYGKLSLDAYAMVPTLHGRDYS